MGINKDQKIEIIEVFRRETGSVCLKVKLFLSFSLQFEPSSTDRSSRLFTFQSHNYRRQLKNLTILLLRIRLSLPSDLLAFSSDGCALNNEGYSWQAKSTGRERYELENDWHWIFCFCRRGREENGGKVQ